MLIDGCINTGLGNHAASFILTCETNQEAFSWSAFMPALLPIAS